MLKSIFQFELVNLINNFFGFCGCGFKFVEKSVDLQDLWFSSSIFGAATVDMGYPI